MVFAAPVILNSLRQGDGGVICVRLRGIDLSIGSVAELREKILDRPVAGAAWMGVYGLLQCKEAVPNGEVIFGGVSFVVGIE